MLPADEKIEQLEERTDSLESIFGQFMSQTGAAMLRIERTIERMEQEATKDRREWNKRWGDLAHKMGTF